jgi:hypothetical protein
MTDGRYMTTLKRWAAMDDHDFEAFGGCGP